MSISRTTSRRSTREQRREDLGARILAAFPSVLAEGATFASASVERLMAAAGGGRSTFYLYFQDKSELLETWFVPIAADLAALDAARSGIEQDLADDVLRDALLETVEVHRRHQLALSIILAATAYDPHIRSVVNTATEATISVWAKRLRRGQREGWIGEQISARETAAWLTLMTTRGATEMVSAPDVEGRVLVDSYVRVVRAALHGSSRG